MNIIIKLKNNTETEQATKIVLEKLLETYPLTQWIKCPEVLIEQGATGKAFPVVRLSAWRPDSGDQLLAQFIHEQSHWIEVGRESEMVQAIEELKELFPDAPINKPEGGGNEKSTYAHLVICRLELVRLSEILSDERAVALVSSNANYTWIRKMVIERGFEIDGVIRKYFPQILG